MKIIRKLRRVADEFIGGVVGILIEAAVLAALASIGLMIAVVVAWIF